MILCEIDGINDLLDAQMNDIVAIFNSHHAMSVQTSSSPDERAKLWKARKASFGAIGKISPSYCTQDACVPRSMLRQVLSHVAKIGEQFGLDDQQYLSRRRRECASDFCVTTNGMPPRSPT